MSQQELKKCLQVIFKLNYLTFLVYTKKLFTSDLVAGDGFDNKTIDCVDMNVKMICNNCEQLLHIIFGSVCLTIVIISWSATT